MKKILKTFTGSLALLLMSVGPVSADTLIKFGLDEPGTDSSGPDLQYILNTIRFSVF